MWVKVICLIGELTSNWSGNSGLCSGVKTPRWLQEPAAQRCTLVSLTSDQRAKQTGGSEKETGAGGGEDEEDGGGEEEETGGAQKVSGTSGRRKSTSLLCFWGFVLCVFFDAPAGCRKREERLRRVNEAKVKEEQKEEQKKKKIEQKMAQIDEKNDKVRHLGRLRSASPPGGSALTLRLRLQRLADEKAKKAAKRQEELEQKKKLEEEARKKKV